MEFTNIVSAFQPSLSVTAYLSMNSQAISSVWVTCCYYENISGNSLWKTNLYSAFAKREYLKYIPRTYHSIKGSISDNLFEQTKAWTCVDLIKIYLRETVLFELAPFTNKQYHSTYSYERHSEVWFLSWITRIICFLQFLSLAEHRLKEILYVIWLQCCIKNTTLCKVLHHIEKQYVDWI